MILLLLLAFSCGVFITGGIIVRIHVELIISEATLNQHCQENNNMGRIYGTLNHAAVLGSGQFFEGKIASQLQVDLCEAFARV